ncbi:MAG: hypothetical protein Q9188_007510 [Gyalolechia gomerana]
MVGLNTGCRHITSKVEAEARAEKEIRAAIAAVEEAERQAVEERRKQERREEEEIRAAIAAVEEAELEAAEKRTEQERRQEEAGAEEAR